MANETMAKAKMASESVLSYLGNVKIADDIITDGALVVLDGLADNAVYGTGVLDDNVFKGKKPAAVTDEVVIVDIAGVSNGVIAGNNYKIGNKLVGLTAEANTAVRYRVPMKGDMFWLSDSCFEGTPDLTTNKYAIPTASSYKHTAVAKSGISDAKYVIKLLDKKDFTIGMTKIGTMFLCQVQ